MSRHLDSTVAVDADSRADDWRGSVPAHRAEPTYEEVRKVLQEEVAWMGWCKENSIDPDLDSLLDYERTVGWLFIEGSQE